MKITIVVVMLGSLNGFVVQGALPDGFEYVGEGWCAVTEDCDSWVCNSSYFWRYTYPSRRATNLEDCAAEALRAGAQAFFVDNIGRYCSIVPPQNTTISTGEYCPYVSTSCPARSPYGNYKKHDWVWEDYAGVTPVLGVFPNLSWSCYRACCQDATAECWACWIDVSVMEYCAASPSTDGCDCNHSNGIQGYNFSHDGYWDGSIQIPMGSSQSAQACADMCSLDAACVAIDTDGRSCYHYIDSYGSEIASTSYKAYISCY